MIFTRRTSQLQSRGRDELLKNGIEELGIPLPLSIEVDVSAVIAWIQSRKPHSAQT
jgi:hypothetical protein